MVPNHNGSLFERVKSVLEAVVGLWVFGIFVITGWGEESGGMDWGIEEAEFRGYGGLGGN